MLQLRYCEYSISVVATRGKRGHGIRRRDQPDSRVPGSWKAFLRVNENKTELFGYLADQAITVTFEIEKQIITTKGKKRFESYTDRRKQ
ncbi:hypothetical protein DPMN_062322 [Dreissena polymorpha]|uniref:Uncharacterized protein n=1 Tax=Dreissena polymorpha TaxID=45954 RepID=A0A9D4C927_DREPO|nr:hypothetical protein DPMN_062322 [Dreissena polymorpha]